MSFAISRGKIIAECGSIITNSSITETTIDMDGGIITSAGTPINGTDVANKDYVDSVSSGLDIVIISLTSTIYTTILNNQYGNLQLYIKNLVTNGPSASFTLNKSEPSRQTSYVRTTSSAGLNTLEKLDIRWNPNSGVQLKKTGINYDGDYQIKYILND